MLSPTYKINFEDQCCFCLLSLNANFSVKTTTPNIIFEDLHAVLVGYEETLLPLRDSLAERTRNRARKSPAAWNNEARVISR